MIPSRIRSNSNWLVLYRLNPNDFETVYKDVIMIQPQKWEELLHFVYGDPYSKDND